jgi:hypothetical protein
MAIIGRGLVAKNPQELTTVKAPGGRCGIILILARLRARGIRART